MASPALREDNPHILRALLHFDDVSWTKQPGTPLMEAHLAEAGANGDRHKAPRKVL